MLVCKASLRISKSTIQYKTMHYYCYYYCYCQELTCWKYQFILLWFNTGWKSLLAFKPLISKTKSVFSRKPSGYSLYAENIYSGILHTSHIHTWNKNKTNKNSFQAYLNLLVCLNMEYLLFSDTSWEELVIRAWSLTPLYRSQHVWFWGLSQSLS